MAEAFGIVAGSIGIAAAFTACVDCFNYVQLGRRLGRDFQTDLLALNGTRLRLSRWGQAVNINEDPQLGRADATVEEIQTVYDSLFQILVLFSNSEKISKRYLEGKPSEDLSLLKARDLDNTTASAANWMKTRVARQQHGRGFLKGTTWALYHRPELRELISDINRLFNVIENLFPAKEAQKALAKEEASEIHDRDCLALLTSVSEGLDPAFHNATKEALAGPQYSNIKNDGMLLAGDEFGDNWERGAVGRNLSYNRITNGENGKAHLGTKYGGKSFIAG